MREKIFRFKQFSVKNDLSAMKVGTDGVLIGAWASVGQETHRVLDVGAGTGLVSLMIAQRCATADIVGVEIDNDAVDEARENILNSPWSSRISICHADFTQFGQLDNGKFDLIVSNPPFFNNGIHAPQQSRAVARHTDTLELGTFIATCKDILADNGAISFIYPISELNRIKEVARDNNLNVSHITTVYPSPSLPAKRVLVEMRKENVALVEDSLIIELSRHCYSQDYIDKTKDFYLKM